LGGDAGVFLADGSQPGFGGLQGERVIPDRQDDIEVQGAAGGALGPDIVDMNGGLRGFGGSYEMTGGKAGLPAEYYPTKPDMVSMKYRNACTRSPMNSRLVALSHSKLSG